jgi:hypothetical protein
MFSCCCPVIKAKEDRQSFEEIKHNIALAKKAGLSSIELNSVPSLAVIKELESYGYEVTHAQTIMLITWD